MQQQCRHSGRWHAPPPHVAVDSSSHANPRPRPAAAASTCRLHFDAVTNQITDQWTWRGASTDEAKWLLTRSYKPFDYDTFLSSSSSSSGADEQHALSPGQLAAAAAQAAAAAAAGSSSAFGGVADGSTAQRARAKGSALLFREVFGAVPGSDVAQLDAALSADYRCQEATGVWRGMNLASREACISYCQQRQKQLSGSPHWHSEAMSSDGKLLFVHFQNVLTDRQSKTLAGLSSGVLVHVFDGWQRINRWAAAPAAAAVRRLLHSSRSKEVMNWWCHWWQSLFRATAAATAAAAAMPPRYLPCMLPCCADDHCCVGVDLLQYGCCLAGYVACATLPPSASLNLYALCHCRCPRRHRRRTLMFRGPMSLSERAEFFNMDCRACGRDQAQTLGVSDSVLGGM